MPYGPAMDDAGGIEDGMLDDEVGETQWTAGTRASYRSATLALLEVLRRHAELVGTRAGWQAELEPYFDSVEALGSALGLFRDAEFDLTGSTPFPPWGGRTTRTKRTRVWCRWSAGGSLSSTGPSSRCWTRLA